MSSSSLFSFGMPPLQAKSAVPSVALPLALSMSSLTLPGAFRARWARALSTSIFRASFFASSTSATADSAIFCASAFLSASSRPKAKFSEISTSHAVMSSVTGMAPPGAPPPLPPPPRPDTTFNASRIAVVSWITWRCHPSRHIGRTQSQKTRDALYTRKPYLSLFCGLVAMLKACVTKSRAYLSCCSRCEPLSRKVSVPRRAS
mmetsp:Transcript_43549/g.112515  ORF Transcript_43549/g.112515 Transcript_43549/m.112515 type:complete len:204 (-) Transcript_43549:305-916(-)